MFLNRLPRRKRLGYIKIEFFSPRQNRKPGDEIRSPPDVFRDYERQMLRYRSQIELQS
jgi:hypothetical protein